MDVKDLIQKYYKPRVDYYERVAESELNGIYDDIKYAMGRGDETVLYLQNIKEVREIVFKKLNLAGFELIPITVLGCRISWEKYLTNSQE